jgi:hypothetical protein
VSTLIFREHYIFLNHDIDWPKQEDRVKHRSSLQDAVTRGFPYSAYTILICSIIIAFILAFAHLDDAIAQESSYIVRVRQSEP